MTTTVDIVNRALQAIGTRTTVTADELANATSNEAIQANLILEDVRDDLLRMAPWNCSTSVGLLTLVVALPGTPENPGTFNGVWAPGMPLPPWLYEYLYPDDCLRILGIVPQAVATQTVPIFPVTTGFDLSASGPPIKFKIGLDKYQATPKRVVLTNQPAALASYVQKVTDPNLMDTLFLSAWSDILASKLAMALTGDKNLTKMLIESANRTIVEARAVDGNEDVPVNDVLPDWIRARGFGAPSPWVGGFNWGPLWPTA